MRVCKVCGAPARNGVIEHSKACFQISADGGGEEEVDDDEPVGIEPKALVAALLEIVRERQWEFDDNPRKHNYCRACNASNLHSARRNIGDLNHEPNCPLAAAIKAAEEFILEPR